MTTTITTTTATMTATTTAMTTPPTTQGVAGVTADINKLAPTYTAVYLAATVLLLLLYVSTSGRSYRNWQHHIARGCARCLLARCCNCCCRSSHGSARRTPVRRACCCVCLSFSLLLSVSVCVSVSPALSLSLCLSWLAAALARRDGAPVSWLAGLAGCVIPGWVRLLPRLLSSD